MNQDSVQTEPKAKRLLLYGLIAAVAGVILFMRRPDAVLNAQFWAEDGKFWYADAYQYGLRSLLIPEAGYLHILPRLAACLSLLTPLAYAPLVMNVCGLLAEALPIPVFLSDRYESIPRSTRLFGALLYLVLPNSFEIHASATNIQWHLGLTSCLILLADSEASGGTRLRIFDCSVIALTALDSPLGLFLIPIAALQWWLRRDRRSLWSVWLLIPGSLIQVLVALFSNSRRIAPNGATLVRFTSILGGQVFFSSLTGLRSLIRLYFFSDKRYLFPVETVSLLVGLAVVVVCARHAPTRLKLFLLFAGLEFFAALRNPLASMETGYYQWALLQIPGVGNRYYFYPMIALIASLVWAYGSNSLPKVTRGFAAALLLCLPVGIFMDFQYRPLVDLQFKAFAQEFEKAPPGAQIRIPVNPVIRGYDWSLRLTKR